MTYSDFKKQAGFGSSLAIGAGAGALAGGLASLLPSSTKSRKKRLLRALMLIGSGAIIGGNVGLLVGKLGKSTAPKTFREQTLASKKMSPAKRDDYEKLYKEEYEAYNKYLKSGLVEFSNGLPDYPILTDSLAKDYLVRRDSMQRGEAPNPLRDASLDAAVQNGLDIKMLEKEGFPYISGWRDHTRPHPLQNTMPASFYLNR